MTRPKVCLIVEDDARLGRALARTLTGYGWSCAHAPDIRTARLLAPGADVVLLDWQPMGKPLAKEIDRPVVVYTGAPGVAEIDLSAMGRRCPVLEKPTPGDVIDTALREAAGL